MNISQHSLYFQVYILTYSKLHFSRKRAIYRILTIINQRLSEDCIMCKALCWGEKMMQTYSQYEYSFTPKGLQFHCYTRSCRAGPVYHKGTTKHQTRRSEPEKRQAIHKRTLRMTAKCSTAIMESRTQGNSTFKGFE